MCGFAGFIDLGQRVRDADSLLRSMGETIVHRGPDDSGVWIDPERARVGMAFRRLSIMDLSPAGHQPMVSRNGALTIVFNGEIYNHRELRAQLEREGQAFRGGSDTEVLLGAVTQWGVEATLARLEGMFALVIFDRTEQCVWLVRDRLGVKPLYWGLTGDNCPSATLDVLPTASTLLFGSELKALLVAPELRRELDVGAVQGFLQYSYVPGDGSILRHVRRVPPGGLARIDLRSGAMTQRLWWRAEDVVSAGDAVPFTGSDSETIEAVDAALLRAVGRRMEADVPLGAFLSGGYDSTAVVAGMQAQAATPVKTFTIGFESAGFDEAPFARRVADHLGTDHTEVYLSDAEAMELVPSLAEMWDEPFGDSSQIPTALVSRVARRSVTVALSGDGGDELFGGYYRYSWIPSIDRRRQSMPGWLRAAAGLGLRTAPQQLLNRAGATAMRLAPGRVSMDKLGDRIGKLQRMWSAGDAWAMYGEALVVMPQARAWLASAVSTSAGAVDLRRVPEDLPVETRMMCGDLLHYLPGDILTKVDRASMSCSLEAREPLLDRELLELAFRLPLHAKIREGDRKWVLKQVVHKRVPKSLMDRPKMGFAIPLASWLRGGLRDWAEDLLSETRLREAGLLRVDAVRSLWGRVLARGAAADAQAIWNILMLESWRRRWMP